MVKMLCVEVKIKIQEAQIFMEKMNSVDSNMNNNIVVQYVVRQTQEHPQHSCAFKVGYFALIAIYIYIWYLL